MANSDQDYSKPEGPGENGWVQLSDVLGVIHRSISDAQSNLAKLETTQGHLVLKDLRMSLPAELSVTRDGRTRVRFPSAARALDPDFRDAHLAQINFTLSYIPVSPD